MYINVDNSLMIWYELVEFGDFKQIKEAMQEANHEQKDTMSRMEQKFFDEKVRFNTEYIFRFSNYNKKSC